VAAWEASSGRLTSGGDHLCTDGSPAATTTSAPSGSPAEATSRSNHLYTEQPHQRRRPPLRRDHLSVRAMEKRSSPRLPTWVRTRPSKPWSWEHGGRRCLRSGRDRVAEVRLFHKAGDHPFPPNAGGRGGPPAHVRGEAAAQLALHHREADEHP
jgi:hypothetical protein